MKSYFIIDIDIHDADQFREYVRLAPSTVAAAGGVFLVRGGAHRILEGEPALHRMIVIEFPNRAAFDGWYQSSEYRDLLALRDRCSSSVAFVVDGVAHA